MPHKYLIEALKARGYFVILVDYYKNPPAAPSADVHIQESTLDQGKVLEIAKAKRASLVISGCVDQANVTACYVAERLGLPAPYSYETALRVTDKALMKAGLARAGVPTASYEVLDRLSTATYECDSFPKVVKPCDCNGSKGVRKVDNRHDLISAIESACKLSRSGKCIVEDFNPGFEVSGYFHLGVDGAEVLYIKRKSLPNDSGLAQLQSYISLGPERLLPAVRATFKEIVEKIATEFGLSNTPVLVQANINGEEVKVIEFAPRVGGGLAFREIKLGTDFDLIEAAISSYLGESLPRRKSREATGIVSIVHMYGVRSNFSHVEGHHSLVAEGVVREFHFHKTPGSPMSCEDLASRNRVLGAIIEGTSVEEIQHKVRTVARRLKIVSTSGEDVFARGLLLPSSSFHDSPMFRH